MTVPIYQDKEINNIKTQSFKDLYKPAMDYGGPARLEYSIDGTIKVSSDTAFIKPINVDADYNTWAILVIGDDLFQSYKLANTSTYRPIRSYCLYYTSSF